MLAHCGYILSAYVSANEWLKNEWMKYRNGKNISWNSVELLNISVDVDLKNPASVGLYRSQYDTQFILLKWHSFFSRLPLQWHLNFNLSPDFRRFNHFQHFYFKWHFNFTQNCHFKLTLQLLSALKFSFSTSTSTATSTTTSTVKATFNYFEHFNSKISPINVYFFQPLLVWISISTNLYISSEIREDLHYECYVCGHYRANTG